MCFLFRSRHALKRTPLPPLSFSTQQPCRWDAMAELTPCFDWRGSVGCTWFFEWWRLRSLHTRMAHRVSEQCECFFCETQGHYDPCTFLPPGRATCVCSCIVEAYRTETHVTSMPIEFIAPIVPQAAVVTSSQVLDGYRPFHHVGSFTTSWPNICCFSCSDHWMIWALGALVPWNKLNRCSCACMLWVFVACLASSQTGTSCMTLSFGTSRQTKRSGMPIDPIQATLVKRDPWNFSWFLWNSGNCCLYNPWAVIDMCSACFLPDLREDPHWQDQ